MKPPLLLYSASTWLAYSIAERFYGGIHYAWCSPVYDGTTAPAHINIPPSSSPAEIYRIFAEDARRGERHSDAITRNRAGIERGVKEKLAAGVIQEPVYSRIYDILDRASPRDYRPVLFVMPFERVAELALEVSVGDLAHPLSLEYRVDRLPRDAFHMIELRS
jgi:hypothetical protein